MRAITKLAQTRNNGVGRDILTLPCHAKTAIGVIEARLSNALHLSDATLDIANTCGAIDAFNSKIEPVQASLGIAMNESGKVYRGGHGQSLLSVQDDTIF
jgi:hypothetical protein